jgi:hypothetical protein
MRVSSILERRKAKEHIYTLRVSDDCFTRRLLGVSMHGKKPSVLFVYMNAGRGKASQILRNLSDRVMALGPYSSTKS